MDDYIERQKRAEVVSGLADEHYRDRCQEAGISVKNVPNALATLAEFEAHPAKFWPRSGRLPSIPARRRAPNEQGGGEGASA